MIKVFKKNNNQPVRLAKKESNETLKFLTGVMKSPEFWVIVIFIICFILTIIFAWENATPEKVYNLGNINIR